MFVCLRILITVFLASFLTTSVVLVTGASEGADHASAEPEYGAVTRSGVHCLAGDSCQPDSSGSLSCHVAGGHRERCCHPRSGCKRLWRISLTSRRRCSTAAKETDEEQLTEESTEWCDVEASNVTLYGLDCADGEFCGFFGEKYRWCWTDSDHTNWDFCCLSGFCRASYVDDGHFSHGCTACKNERKNCGKGCSYTVCNPEWYRCNPVAVYRSIRNYACFSPCTEDWTQYGWCWLDSTQSNWDWCCATGETCGVVRTKDRPSNGTVCYVGRDKIWPMECREGAEPTPLPVGYESPPTPVDWGHFAAGIAEVHPAYKFESPRSDPIALQLMTTLYSAQSQPGAYPSESVRTSESRLSGLEHPQA